MIIPGPGFQLRPVWPQVYLPHNAWSPEGVRAARREPRAAVRAVRRTVLLDAVRVVCIVHCVLVATVFQQMAVKCLVTIFFLKKRIRIYDFFWQVAVMCLEEGTLMLIRQRSCMNKQQSCQYYY